MSKNYDSGMNSARAVPNGYVGGRSIEYSSGSSVYIWVWVDAANVMWYAYGEDNSWSTQQLSGAAGALGHNVNISEVAVAIDHIDDSAHIAYVDSSNNQVYHAECVDVDNPIGANWTVWGVNPYQRCDATASAKSRVSIAVDSNTGAGTQSPHIIWQEVGTSIRYNGGIDAAHTMGTPVTLANTPGETFPTIVVAEDEGRELYAFWVDAAGTSVECMKVIDPANPQNIANWGGPSVGAGGGVDTPLTPGGSDTAISGPSASWWWDADERVIVAAVLTGAGGTNAIVTNYWDETAGPAAWAGQATASSASFTPSDCMVVNRGNANKWTAYAVDPAGDIEFALSDNSYSFAGKTWYTQATTGPAGGSFMSSEWRHLELISADHSAAVWVDGTSNLWYGETRINSATAPTLVSPVSGEYKDETGAITFTWSFNDSESDIQREYYVQIDNDAGFGSPVADPGSGLRLDTWVTSAVETGDLNASVLSANTTYYWHVKTRDSEYGTEYDPYSESSYSSSETLKTTPQISIAVSGSSQLADKSVAVEFSITLPAGMFSGYGEITAYEYDSGGGFGAFTRDTTYDAPVGQFLDALEISGGTTYFTMGWNADSDLAADYDDTVDIKLTARWASDAHGLGTVNDTEADVAIDFAAPTATDIGSPCGGTTTTSKPTFTVSASDTNGWEFKIEIYRDAGYSVLFDDSGGYLGVGTTTWTMNDALDIAGTWYAQVKTRDGTVGQNEVVAWVQETFTYSPPPAPSLCLDGTWTLEVDPTKVWSGSEFSILDDVTGSVKFVQRINSPNSIEFVLNNYSGRYADSSSDFYIKMGDEVKMWRSSGDFYGVVKSIERDTENARYMRIYCESFVGAADSFPVQLRVVPTSQSGMCWEDYINLALSSAGTKPKWFSFVDLDGDRWFYERSDKTPVLGASDIVYNKVSHVAFLNDVVARTGKVWFEADTPTGRKSYIYFGDAANPSEDSVDATFYLDSDIINENITEDEDSIVNRVVFTDADVMEQDMNSIRTYGMHTLLMNSEGTVDATRLAEIAQYIIEERKVPRATGTIPLFGEPDISLNQLVRIYENTSDDTKSGLSGNYIVAAIDRSIGRTTETKISLNSRWENPIVKQIQQVLRSQNTDTSGDVIVVLRAETAEARLECPEDGTTLSTVADNVGRIGIDRLSDTDSDSDYYTSYGGPS